MAKESAGLLPIRRRDGEVEVLLAHPGGPYWAKKDAGAWSIVKGELEPGEDALDAARREFEEETGHRPDGPFHPLGSVRQKAGKVVHAWSFETTWEPDGALPCNRVRIEWPPRSGRTIEFPEIDRVEYFPLDAAREKVNAAQVSFLDRLP